MACLVGTRDPWRQHSTWVGGPPVSAVNPPFIFDRCPVSAFVAELQMSSKMAQLRCGQAQTGKASDSDQLMAVELRSASAPPCHKGQLQKVGYGAPPAVATLARVHLAPDNRGGGSPRDRSYRVTLTGCLQYGGPRLQNG